MKRRLFLLLLVAGVLSSFLFYQRYLLQHPRYTPQVDFIDLTSLLEKQTFNDTDYEIFYQQTGLARPLIDALTTEPDFKEQITHFQENYLKEVTVYSESLPPLTTCEFVGDPSDSEMHQAFKLGPYRKGYLFFTKSTFTMDWRHGHIGIVTDEIRGITLEALNPGSPAMEQSVRKWEYYPTFKMMRLKDASQSELNAIADYALIHLKGLPYNILADKNQDPLKDTHCALLIWQAFNHFGYDLDATGGLFVSPKNIASSPLLETLQIYGFDPDKEW